MLDIDRQHDLMSPVTLFLQADIVVKVVMVGPARSPASGPGRSSSPTGCGCAASAATTSGSSATSGSPRISTASTRAAARANCRLPPRCSPPASPNGAARPRRQDVDRDGTRARLAVAMNAAVAAETDRLAARLNILATVGSVAPFVGLFGTVWGIMRSFTDIAGAQNTSLAVVAPGIAEALFATAHRPVRGDPGGDRLQPLQPRHQPARGAPQALRRRLPRARSAASWRSRPDGDGPPRPAGAAARRRAPMAEINVTPMVDVMLVLLIIFMVTAPLLAAGVPVDLPESKAGALDQNRPSRSQISIDGTGAIFVDDAPVPTRRWPAALAADRRASRRRRRAAHLPARRPAASITAGSCG